MDRRMKLLDFVAHRWAAGSWTYYEKLAEQAMEAGDRASFYHFQHKASKHRRKCRRLAAQYGWDTPR